MLNHTGSVCPSHSWAHRTKPVLRHVRPHFSAKVILVFPPVPTLETMVLLGISLCYLTNIPLSYLCWTNERVVWTMGQLRFLSFGMEDLCLLTLLHTPLKFWLRWRCWTLFIHSLIIEHLPCIRHSPMCRGKVMSKTNKFLASLTSFSPEEDKHRSNNPRNKNILLQIEVCINFDCFWL